jgi:heptosyltransferase II
MTAILVVAPNWVGDAVMTQPLIRELHAQSTVTIDVIGPTWVLPVFTRMAGIAKTWSVPFGHGEFPWRKVLATAREIRARQYDQAIVLPNSLKSSLLPWLAKIPRRTGYLGESRYGLINDRHTLDASAMPRMVDRFTALTRAPGSPLPSAQHPRLTTDSATVNATLARHGLALHQPVTALCPGAEYGPAKRWPTRYFADIANAAFTRQRQVWLFGSKKDREVADEIQTASGGRCVDLTGRTSLDEAIDLLSVAEHVLTNDSGLMHVAAALERPLVAIYGSSSPGFTPPLARKAKVVSLNLACSPCFKRVCPLGHTHCLEQLKPGLVVQALAELAASDTPAL